MNRNKSKLLPTWVVSGSCTGSFWAWLEGTETKSTWENLDYTVVKVEQGNFFYLYLQKRTGKNLIPGNDLNFAGLFSKKNSSLYDVDEKLTAMLGLPEEMGFPNRADIRKDAERCISQKAEEMLSASWQDFLYQSGCDTKSLLPMVRRSEIRERAERYYLQNGSLADIHFIPQISLEASFSDAIYLLFLEYGEQAAEKIARQWIKRNIPYISQQRILYGCVRDEFREILDTPNDRIHKIKHLIQALNETRHKAVQVILCRKKKVIQVNMSVEELCNPKGYYSIRGCSQKDRATLERMFGKTAEFRIEDIQSVSYGGIVLYENVASRNAA